MFNFESLIYEVEKAFHNPIVLRSVIAVFLLIIIIAGCILIPDNELPSSAQQVVSPNLSTSTPNDAQLLLTAQALATQIGGGSLIETAQAYATAQAPREITPEPTIENTIDEQLSNTPNASQPAEQTGNMPDDIPLPGGEKESFYSSINFVSFHTNTDLQSVIEFYQLEMPSHDWLAVDAGSYTTSNAAQLNFEKDGRKATISIQKNPLAERITVVITLQNR